MNVGVVLDIEKGKISYASIAPGSVLPRPARITAAEEILLGQAPNQDLARQAGEAVAATMVAVSGRRWSTDYKEPVIIALVERAIKQALGVEWR
jgi:CO/xanthine dehydrogenase FAD-binding subunit